MSDRIDRLAVDLQLEVHMRPGLAAGAADETDELAAHHRFAGLDARRESHEVTVHRGELALMLNAHPVAITSV